MNPTSRLAAGLLAALTLTAPALTVTVDPASPWIGYMNVFNLPADGGAYQFGSGWGPADLNAVFTGPILKLSPNTIGDPNVYWYIGGGAPGSPGNKIMEANMYVEKSGELSGQSVTFTGTVTGYTLNSAYTCVAFIKDFAPNYSSFTQTTAVLSAGTTFRITLNTDPAAGRHVQYGFTTTGRNVWATDPALPGLGSVLVTAAALTPPAVQAAPQSGTLLSWSPAPTGSYQPQRSADGTTWADFGPAFEGDAVNIAFDPLALPFHRVHLTPSTGPASTVPSTELPGIQLTWPTTSGTNYQVQSTPDLATWNNLGSPLTGTGDPSVLLDPLGGPSTFYRVLVQ